MINLYIVKKLGNFIFREVVRKMSPVTEQTPQQSTSGESVTEQIPPSPICKIFGIKFKYEGDPKKWKSQNGQELKYTLASLFQSEHLSLLFGSGFSMGVTKNSKPMPGLTVYGNKELPEWAKGVDTIKDSSITIEWLETVGENGTSIEEFIEHLETAVKFYKNDESNKEKYQTLQNQILQTLSEKILEAEESVLEESEKKGGNPTLEEGSEFLLRLITRPAHLNRPHIFTTNYDRLIEYICEQLQIRIIDRFIGTLNPKLSFEPPNINYHYTPPGIKGEPRYLEHVVYYTKLHGSLDWADFNSGVHRFPLSFGKTNTDIKNAPSLIYPKASKSMETLLFPYSELFRDFQHAICRHNSLLITYGYSFRDSHINSIIESMLKIPTTHLLIITKDNNEKIEEFIKKVNVSYMIGDEFTDFNQLNQEILPTPIIYKHLQRAYKIQQDQTPYIKPDPKDSQGSSTSHHQDNTVSGEDDVLY